ncbi:MAG: hypothetical protein GKR89_03435 [Candidatus Latescibacteria bacterium]|nr:hypothetical protein [Candidatus Latescibacterota bacterium]
MIAVLLLALLAASPLMAAQPYSCGPFLLQPGPTQMTVVIDHETPVDATLTLRRADKSDKEQKLRHPEAQRHHIFPLEGLHPDTQYSYQIKSSRGLASATHYFRTLPEAPTRYRLIGLGDVRSRPEIWHQVSERIFADEQDALFIIGTGDYPADGSKYQQWIDQFFQPARNLLGRMPIWPAIGNHERTRQSGDPREFESHFFSLFELPGNERWYRVDYGYTTVLIIDSNTTMEPGSPQYDWLREQLRGPRRRFTLAAFHHAPLTSGPHGRLQDDGTPREWPIDQGQRFLVPLFEMYGVDLVLNGHDHLYERSLKNGVYYVITGGGGAPLYSVNSAPNPYQQVAQAVNHYTTLDITGTTISLTAIDVEGQIIDWFKIPLGKTAIARKRHDITTQLQQAFQLGPIDKTNQTADLTISNPLPFPIQARLLAPLAEGGQQPSFALTPGAGQQTRLALADYAPKTQKPSWHGWVHAPVQVAFSGDDGGLPVDIELAHQLTLVEPVYQVASMATPTIDGRLDEWAALEPMRLDNQSPLIDGPKAYRGNDDMQAQIWLGWSPQGLHLAVQVEDDDILDDPGRSIWLTDSIETFWDGRPQTARSDSYGDWVSQNIFPVERAAEDHFVGNGSWAVDAFAWTVKTGDDGYILEASIPFALLKEGGNAQVGDQLRFDLIINDQDARDPNQSRHKLWSEASASSHTDGYGLLQLK